MMFDSMGRICRYLLGAAIWLLWGACSSCVANECPTVGTVPEAVVYVINGGSYLQLHDAEVVVDEDSVVIEYTNDDLRFRVTYAVGVQL